jgi:hypothetical protein
MIEVGDGQHHDRAFNAVALTVSGTAIEIGRRALATVAGAR